MNNKILQKESKDIFYMHKRSRRSCSLWDNMENMVQPKRPQMILFKSVHVGYINIYIYIYIYTYVNLSCNKTKKNLKFFHF